MHDRRTRFRKPRAFAIGEMNAMPEQAALAQQPVMVIDIGVVSRIRKQRLHQCDFADALRKMRLHQGTGQRLQKLRRQSQFPVARCHDEARRHRIAQAVLAVPLSVQFLAVTRARLGIIEHRCRRIAVHHRLAGDKTHAALVRGREQRLGTGAMHRAEGQCRRGPVLDQPIEEDFGRRRGIGRIDILALLRKRETIEPVEQVLSRRGEHPVLRKMDMRVDEARQHQAVAIIIDGSRRKAARQKRDRPAPQDRAVIANHDSALLFMAQFGGRSPKLTVCPRMTRVMPRPCLRCEKRKMRQICSIASANSSSGVLLIRSLKLSRICCFVAPLTAKMKGKSNFDL